MVLPDHIIILAYGQKALSQEKNNQIKPRSSWPPDT